MMGSMTHNSETNWTGEVSAGTPASAVRAGALAGAVTGAAPSTQRRIGPV